MNNETQAPDTDLVKLMTKLWASACQDQPERPSCQVINGHFVLTIKGNQGRWAEMTAAAGVPATAAQTQDGDTLTCTWPSHADAIFGPGGLVADLMPGYEMRLPQLHMARMVQRSIEMRQPAVIEAGTGTGKSLAYAAICMAMDKRVTISTSNKALQMQLVRKDIPFLQQIFPGKKLALVQGKNNYACRLKAEDIQAGTYTVGGNLLEWYLSTKDGNIETIPFAVEPEELRKLATDKYCAGKACSRYGDCHYYAAKRERAEADVLVCNHALLALHELYPGAGILPPVDVVVVDEAHKLADYIRNAVGAEAGLDTVRRRIDLAAKHDADIEAADVEATQFFREVLAYVGQSTDREIGVAHEEALAAGLRLAPAMMDLADQVWADGDMPQSGEERRRLVDARSIRVTAAAVNDFSRPTVAGYVRWIEQDDGSLRIRNVPFDVSRWLRKLAGFEMTEVTARDHTHCARCGRTLTAAAVHVLDGLPYDPECVRHMDPFGDADLVELAVWLEQEHPEPGLIHNAPKAVVFTSATLAAPDMSAFLREAGLPYALQMVAASPFDYANNALLYVPSAAAPAPNKDGYKDWLVEEMGRLVKASCGGAFLLFTSYANMRYVSDRLRWEIEQAGLPVFVQGQLPKLEIVKRFLESGNAVLFAVKSFWEGVSIDGQALRLVCIDKLPFEAPSPLNQAQEAALTLWARGQGMTGKAAEWYPFEALRVPRMVIDLKQGTGRLIRTQSDWGVIAILDSRLRAAQYARRLVLPALPPARRVSDLWQVSEFYADRRDQGQRLTTMTPMAQATAVYSQATNIQTDELPF